MSFRFRVALCCVVSILALQSSPASAAIWHFKLFLDGLQEAPPVVTTGTGFAVATLNDQTFNFDLAGSFSGLLGTTTTADIEGPAGPGTTGGVLFNLNIDPGVSSGTFTHTGTVNPLHAQYMLDGLAYVNIRTTFSQTGEIRAQMLSIPAPEPAGVSTLALVSVGMLRRRRA
jgi:hypothetical protein